MTSLLKEQYLALSRFAYNDFSQTDVSEDRKIIELIGAYAIEEEGAPVLNGLDNIGDWELIGFQKNTANGFAAMAFKDPNSNEQVYLFRGTENDEGFNVIKDDWLTNFTLAIGNLPDQFADALTFYNDVQSRHPSTDVSSTGHSLGGSLAQ